MTKKSKSPLFFLYHIKESIEAIESYLKEGTAIIRDNRMIQKAVLYELITIGEAANNISDDFKFIHFEIPWRDITDLRNVLAHHYWAVSIDIVEKVITDNDKLPAVKILINSLIAELENTSSN